ncbi:MAG TPA: hypothetical protein VH396_18530, partial [Chitinophagaceae bacterium]
TRSIFTFIILIIVIGCVKEFSYENHIAAGTLKDSFGACFSQTIHGTFYNGITPVADTTYVEVKVNVTKTGSYFVSTDEQNGFQFSDSGVFETAGINIIKLKPTGTPLAHIATNFIITFDTSICPVTINVHDSSELNHNNTPDSSLFNNWKFTDTKKGITYKGLFENNYLLALDSLKVLVLSTKKAEAVSDSTFMINIALPAGTIELGTYTTDDPPNGLVFKTFSDACVNCAGGGLIPRSSGATVVFIITSYNPTTKIVKGTFTGTTIDWSNEIAMIKDGEFSAMVK